MDPEASYSVTQMDLVDETSKEILLRLRKQGWSDPNIMTITNATVCIGSGNFWKKTCLVAPKIGIWHCAAVLHTQIPKMRTDLDPSFLYVLIDETCDKFGRENDFV